MFRGDAVEMVVIHYLLFVNILCDVASFRPFKPVRSEPLHDNNRKFLHITFANKGIDASNPLFIVCQRQRHNDTV
jgi:hypothetical protein